MERLGCIRMFSTGSTSGVEVRLQTDFTLSCGVFVGYFCSILCPKSYCGGVDVVDGALGRDGRLLLVVLAMGLRPAIWPGRGSLRSRVTDTALGER